MDIRVASGSYKSIDEAVRWPDVPRFAVLTGENGAGKTQLLRSIYEALQPSLRGTHRVTTGLSMQIDGFNGEPSTIMHFSRLSDPAHSPPVSLTSIQNHVSNIANDARQRNYRDDRHKSFIDEIVNKYSESLQDPSFQMLLATEAIPSFFYSNLNNLTYGVAQHYVNYWLDQTDHMRQGKTESERRATLGAPPWEELNALFEEYSIPYRTNDPLQLTIRGHFVLKFIDTTTGKFVNVEDISSGEAILMRLFMLMLACEHYKDRPSLLLLDEPDSHLHPSMISIFLKVIQNVFIGRLGTRVILTTHRSETVSFAPPEALFEMHKLPPRIRKSQNERSTIALLTKNIVALIKEKRPVFVEDIEDRDFYNSALSIMLAESHWRVDAKPSFIEAGVGDGPRRMPGGKSVVVQVVRKLRDAGAVVVSGIIDRDSGNDPANGVIILDRYSVENYIYDPLVVACVLLENGREIPVAGGGMLRTGDEHRI
jgi:energy-coupling factor transporter ATP-binding protein EcfA2